MNDDSTVIAKINIHLAIDSNPNTKTSKTPVQTLKIHLFMSISKRGYNTIYTINREEKRYN